MLNKQMNAAFVKQTTFNIHVLEYVWFYDDDGGFFFFFFFLSKFFFLFFFLYKFFFNFFSQLERIYPERVVAYSSKSGSKPTAWQ